ncbi:MAG: CPBP family intramembrane metalloprotease [Burkholderiales bacterium]|nr:CPBP family intramembrane metalloprotease [Burkholderiales bacterium]
MTLTVLLLGLAVCAAWAPPITTRWGKLPLWHPLLAASLCAAAASGEVSPGGIAVCIFAWACGALSVALPSPKVRTALKVVTVATCFALGIQKVAGFGPFLVVPDTVISPHAGPMHVNLRLDAGVAGLLLFALYSRRITSLAELRAAWRPALAIAGITTAAILAIAVAIGYVAFDPKLPWFTAVHLVHIALWTCTLEEGLFRGVVQDGLMSAQWVRARAWLAPLPIVAASLLFGLAHVAGGPVLMALAALAGVGYGYAYQRTGRIEAAMLAHFTLDAAHFLWFTYPSLKL